jgi:ribulose-phosphate 3-epimerase
MLTGNSTSIGKWGALATGRLLTEFSLWSADLLRLEQEIRRADPFADLYHIDVSDGHATRALLFFPDLVARVRSVTQKLLHVHLECDSSILLEQIDQFAEVGADVISIGPTSSGGPTGAALERIRRSSKCAGLVIGCDTAPETAEPYLELIQILTLMGTATGVKGEQLVSTAFTRLEQARVVLRKRGMDGSVRIAADGAVRRDTVPNLRASGADIVVTGSLAFGSDNLAATIQWLHSLPRPSWYMDNR